MRRRKLRGVAIGLLTAFVSRNNDVNGYWAIGKLSKLAEVSGVTTVKVDLVTRQTEPITSEYSAMIEQYWVKLLQQLSANGLSERHVQCALIELEPGLSNDILNGDELWGRGAAFRCAITIVDDLAHVYRAERRGRVAPHQPSLEYRSVGRNNWQS